MSVIKVFLLSLLVVSAIEPARATTCEPGASTCSAAALGEPIQGAHILLQTKQFTVGTVMRHDDVDETEEVESEQEKATTLWPVLASDKLCAMETVRSMIGFNYSMYAVFEKGASMSKRDLADCKNSGCVPVFDWDSGRGSFDVKMCQSIAFKRSHSYYAFGMNDEKLRCYTFSDCEESERVVASGFTLYSRPAPTTSETRGSRVSCKGESVIKAAIRAELVTSLNPADEGKGDDGRGTMRRGQWHEGRATILRKAFHDAHDFNGLMAVNKDTNKWEHVASDTGYAGMDGCMYDNPKAELVGGQPSKHGETFEKILANDGRNGATLYNFNLQRLSQNQDPVRIDKLASAFVATVCYDMCCTETRRTGFPAADKPTLCGTDSCASGYYMDTCAVDVMTLGSLVIIEDAGGPQIDMTWGRKQGDCRNPFKNVDVPSHIDTRRIAQGGASLSSFGNAEAVFAEFQGLGFDKSEATALMGAHSFGKIHKYTGGPMTRNKGGGFCIDPTKAQGFFKDGSSISPMTQSVGNEQYLDQYSEPAGTCTPHTATSEGAEACWTNERGWLEPARTGSAADDAGYKVFLRKAKGDETKAKRLATSSWGKGGYWDTTPNKFDNQYFKELHSTDPAEKKNCCGPSTEYGCGSDILEGEMQDKDGNSIDGCNVKWCLRSWGKTTGFLGSGNPTAETPFPDYVAMTTQRYVQSDTPTIDGHIGNHRLYRLAADWALIDDPVAKEVVSKFAADEGAFHTAFKDAWSKVIHLGHETGALSTCET